jgi:hypothetical protein
VVVRLEFDTRVALASRLEMSEVPVAIAIWGDVVDDLALVAELYTSEPAQTPRLERAVTSMQKKLSQQLFLRYLGMLPALRELQVIRSATGVRVVFVLSPRRLQLVVHRISEQLTRQVQKTPMQTPSIREQSIPAADTSNATSPLESKQGSQP